MATRHLPAPFSCKISAMTAAALFLLLALCAPAPLPAAELKPFTSDGCSLFPDGSPAERAKWCDCCFEHDIAYWQGGDAEGRKKADEALRACVLQRTGNKALADAMRLGVRAGGHPVSVMWYRWGYGWELGRGYKALTESEKAQAAAPLEAYKKERPAGFCGAQAQKSTAPAAAHQRPAGWAQPVPSKSLKNLYKLDDKLYRSAQPDKAGFRELEALGIKNVLNLRSLHKDKPGKGSALTLYSVEMEASDITEEQVTEALRFIHKAKGPVLVHCWHGSDRTGIVSAMYRIVFQGWTKEEAVEELVDGGYGYHSIYTNIPKVVRRADIEEIKKKVLAP